MEKNNVLSVLSKLKWFLLHSENKKCMQIFLHRSSLVGTIKGLNIIEMFDILIYQVLFYSNLPVNHLKIKDLFQFGKTMLKYKHIC